MTEESHLIYINYGDYSDWHRFWIPNIRRTIISKTETIDTIDSEKYVCLAIDPNTRGKFKITINGYSDTSLDTIESGIVSNAGDYVIITGHIEVLFIERKVTLVGFYQYTLQEIHPNWGFHSYHWLTLWNYYYFFEE